MEESFEIVLNKWQIKTSFFVQAVATQDLRIITLKLTGQQSGNNTQNYCEMSFIFTRNFLYELLIKLHLQNSKRFENINS
jgi:hypothetical protein